MMELFKKSVKLQSYGFQAKLQIGMLFLYIVIGLFIEFVSKGTQWLGPFFIMLAPMFFCQVLYGLGLSNVVQSSPYKKRLQTTMPAFSSLVLSLIFMTGVIVLKYFEMRWFPKSIKESMFCLLTMAVVSMVMNSYTAIVYKYYLLSMILLIVPLGLISGFSSAVTNSEHLMSKMPMWLQNLQFPTVAIISYVCLILGFILQYGVSLLLYRKPLSQYAQGMMMRSAMKK